MTTRINQEANVDCLEAMIERLVFRPQLSAGEDAGSLARGTALILRRDQSPLVEVGNKILEKFELLASSGTEISADSFYYPWHMSLCGKHWRVSTGERLKGRETDALLPYRVWNYQFVTHR